MKKLNGLKLRPGWIMSLYLVLFLGIVVLSCDREDNDPLPGDGEGRINLRVGSELFNDLENKRRDGKGEEESADFDILEVSREGNLLKVSVSYEGGCDDHTFEVVWDGVVLEIFPCRTGLLLSHKKDSDGGCNKVVNEILEIDLADLFGSANAETLNCSIDVYSMLNETGNPDSVVDIRR